MANINHPDFQLDHGLKRCIFVKGTAGLGNRLYALMTAIAYSKITNRTLIVDWRDKFYSDGTKNIFDDLFHLKNISSLPIETLHEFKGLTHPKIWRGYENLSLEELRFENSLIKAGYNSKMYRCQAMFERYSADIEEVNYQDDLLIHSSYIEEIDKIKNLLNHHNIDLEAQSKQSVLRDIYHKHLELSPQILNLAQRFVKDNFSGKFTLGVYVRQSDLLISIASYLQAVDQFIDENPNTLIFLATDNSSVEDRFRSKYGRVVTYAKWLPPPGQRIHGNSCSPKSVNHAVDELVDLYALSKCQHIIFSSRTTFGRVAALMSNLPSECCIDVDCMRIQKFSAPQTIKELKLTWRKLRTWLLVKIAGAIDLNKLPKIINKIILAII